MWTWTYFEGLQMCLLQQKNLYLYEMSNNSCDDIFIFKIDNLFGLKMASESWFEKGGPLRHNAHREILPFFRIYVSVHVRTS